MEFADRSWDVWRRFGSSAHGEWVTREMCQFGRVINGANASGETLLQTAEASEDPVNCTHGRSRHVIDVRDVRCQINDEPAKAAAAEGGGLPYS